MGRPNVGKSTLMNALVGEKVSIISDKPQTTRNKILGILNGEDSQIVFIDTPGLHKPRTKLGEFMVKEANTSLDGIDGLLVVVDAGRFNEGDRAICSDLTRTRAHRVLAVNKIDIANPEIVPRIIGEMGDKFDDIVPISALRGKGLDELRKVLFGLLPNGPRYFPDDHYTDQPERVIVGELIREKALINLREEIPHGVGVEVMRIEKQREGLLTIHATLYCERGSHKSIIIGKQGSMLGRIGTQARVEIENLLGDRVNLQLWVKVREDWRNQRSALHDLGYD